MALCAAAAPLVSFSSAWAVDNSPAPILQYYEGTYENHMNRTADMFISGFGGIWLPPAGRASTGSGSVGYDPRDRFDLGQWDDKTLHGSEHGLRAFAAQFERIGGDVFLDLVWNHNGFQYDDTPNFVASGAYPGMVVQNPDGGTDPFGVPDTNGDFHGPFAGGNDARFGGLIDIDHSTNHQLIRNPVTPGDPLNIPAGTTDYFGRTANLPDANNARFYPDRDLQPISVFNPSTGEADILIYPFNEADPLAGDPVAENGLGYLMRNARWLVEEIGVEGFRQDIPWHFPEWVQGYFDQAVYRASRRTNLDGSQYHTFSFMEAGQGDQTYLNNRFVKKTIDDNQPGVIGSNYDALDFNFFHDLKDNLTSNGLANDWRNVVYTSLDRNDDGLMNGSAGIKFAASHDDTEPYLTNVAHAYTLMLPGQSTVYFNAKQHGENRDFPRDSRGDIFGGVFGDTITTLLDIRTTHGRGDYRDRVVEKETHIFERSGAAVIGVSNRGDSGYDERTVDVDHPAGTYLVELTGNSQNSASIPDLVMVTEDTPGGQGRATIRVPRNGAGDEGYVIYGLPTPQSQNGIELRQAGDVPVSVLAGSVPAANNLDNGATRLADLYVITEDTFTISVATQPVTLSGTRLDGATIVPDTYRDRDADGDNALFRLDGGLDLNGINPLGTVSGVDFDEVGSALYGFEQFVTINSPGYDAPDGHGLYEQVIDTTQLSEGEHYLTTRVFRHRDDGGPAVFDELKRVIYIDRLDPLAEVYELKAVNAPGSGDHDVVIESTDLTADSMHVFLNLPATMSDADIMLMAQASQGEADRVDVGLFKRYFDSIPEGNNVLTVVTFEPTGNSNVQRFVGQTIGVGEGLGAGFGDFNHDGLITTGDIANSPFGFEAMLYLRNTVFNPAGDLNADGLIDYHDLILMEATLLGAGASQTVLDEFQDVLLRRGDINQSGTTDADDVQALINEYGSDDWLADFDSSGLVDFGDVEALITTVFGTSLGDLDLDGFVGITDLNTLLQNWNQAVPLSDPMADIDGDGFVGIADLNLVLANWNAGTPPTTTANIPEPAGVLTWALAAAYLSYRRRFTHD